MRGSNKIANDRVPPNLKALNSLGQIAPRIPDLDHKSAIVSISNIHPNGLSTNHNQCLSLTTTTIRINEFTRPTFRR